jgi:flagellar M-ring protein FliF
MHNALTQIRNFATSLSMKQRLTISLSAMTVMASIGGLVWFASRPDYKVAVTGLKASSMQTVTGRLAAKNIQYRLSVDGASIEVPSEQIDAARLEIAGNNLANEARLGFEIFDKPNWAASEFSERVNYQRAIEGELERTISTIEGVESARVHLVLPTESLFAERGRKAKASVLVHMNMPSPPQPMLDSVTRLVASAVDGLDPDGITIMDGETGRSFNARSKSDWENASPLDQQLGERLVATLEPIFGVGHIRAAVRVESETSTVEENQESFDPNSSVALTTQRSEERSGGVLSGGVPGTSSNLPNAQGGQQEATAEESSQMSKSESNTFAVNRLARHTQFPAGRLRRISAALLIDDAREVETKETGKQRSRKRTADELKQIEELARATLGLDSARGDVLSVQNIGFASEPTEPAPVMTAPQKVRKVVRDWSLGIRYLAIFFIFALVYLLMFRPFKKQLAAAIQVSTDAIARSRKSQSVVDFSEGVPVIGGAKSPELKRAAALKKELAERIKTEPASATRLLQNWIGEDAVR